MNKIYLFFIISILTIAVSISTTVSYGMENIDPDNDNSQFAYSENTGWINFEPNGDGGDGAEVTDSAVTGFIWSENVGWINLSCENTSSCGTVDYGVVNDGNGNLSGFAYGENIGWCNFNPTEGGVFIDSNGDFNGQAWCENVGWVHFNNQAVPYKVRTTFQGAETSTTSVIVSKRAVAREGNVAEEDITSNTSGPVETLGSAGSDIELTNDTQEGKQQMVGIRFPNILVPQGAIIKSAHIQFESDENRNGPVTITFHGEASNNAILFKEVDGDVSNRSRTTTSVEWNPGDWNTGDEGDEQRTSNLAAIVEEIVLRPGWEQGNAIAFIVSSNDFPNHRTAENGESNGPVLTIEFESEISAFISKQAAAKEGNVAEEDITTAASGPVETLGSAGSDLELTMDSQEDKQQIVGIRFPNINIPNGSDIVEAFIQFESDENRNGPVTITFHGEVSDSAELFQETDGDVSGRLKTSASVDWNPDDWNVGDIDNAQRTPDLAAIVQELVNRAGWSSGNAMAFIVSSDDFTNHRTAENGRSNGPVLIINYR